MKKTNKILAIFTIIAMLVAMVMPFSYAAVTNETEGTETIKITGPVGGKTLELYRLFDIDNDGNYSFNTAAKSEEFFKTVGFKETSSAETNKTFSDIYQVTDYLKKNKDNKDLLMSMAEQYYTFAKANSVSAVASADLTSDADKTATSVEVKANKGYYLIYDTTTTLGNTTKAAPMLSAIPVTGTPAEIVLKADTVAAPKKIVNPTTASVGDEVTYTINSKVPNMIGYNSYVFNFVDTLATGIDYKADSVEVKIGDKTLNLTDDYTVNYTDTNRVLTISMVDFTKWRTDNAGKAITVTYKATLNSNAIKAGETENKVKIDYSNNIVDPSLTSSTDTTAANVHTYSLKFTKINADGETLKDVVFKLKDSSNNVIKIDTNKIVSKDSSAVETVTTGTDGIVEFKGLAAGTYYLEEVTPQEGYAKLGHDVQFVIGEETDADAPTLTCDSTDIKTKGYVKDVKVLDTTTEIKEGITYKHYTLGATILNAREGELPATGGIGTTIFITVGTIVMACAVVAIVVNNKKNK